MNEAAVVAGFVDPGSVEASHAPDRPGSAIPATTLRVSAHSAFSSSPASRFWRLRSRSRFSRGQAQRGAGRLVASLVSRCLSRAGTSPNDQRIDAEFWTARLQSSQLSRHHRAQLACSHVFSSRNVMSAAGRCLAGWRAPPGQSLSSAIATRRPTAGLAQIRGGHRIRLARGSVSGRNQLRWRQAFCPLNLAPASRCPIPLSDRAGRNRLSAAHGSVANEVCYWRDMTLVPHLLNLFGKPRVEATIRFSSPKLSCL